MDADQTVDSSLTSIQSLNPECSLGIFSIQSEEAATSPDLAPLFNAADELVKAQVRFISLYVVFYKLTI
jgi:hypothetical protein